MCKVSDVPVPAEPPRRPAEPAPTRPLPSHQWTLRAQAVSVDSGAAGSRARRRSAGGPPRAASAVVCDGVTFATRLSREAGPTRAQRIRRPPPCRTQEGPHRVTGEPRRSWRLAERRRRRVDVGCAFRSSAITWIGPVIRAGCPIKPLPGWEKPGNPLPDPRARPITDTDLGDHEKPI